MQFQSTQRAALRTAVPVSQCRHGTVLEFSVFEGEIFHATVEAVRVAGARDFLVQVSDVQQVRGPERKYAIPPTSNYRHVNLSHARRVVRHGAAPLVWDMTNSTLDKFRQEFNEFTGTGEVCRRGRRLVMDGRRIPVSTMVQAYLQVYLRDNAQALGKKPWEQVDLFGLLKKLQRAGILSYRTVPLSRSQGAYFPVSAELDVVRMKTFIQQNFNRSKCNLTERVRENERLENEMAERDEQRTQSSLDEQYDYDYSYAV